MGEWSNELVIKSYEPVDQVLDMVEDPAIFAAANNYGGVHNETTRYEVGAWRWKGLVENRSRILELIGDRRTMDFGGLAGPVGYGAEVVDFFSETMRAPYDLPGMVRTVFSSHTFEHVPDLRSLMYALVAKIERPGHLIVFVPSWRLVHLQAENWPHHCHTFCLSKEEEEAIKPDWVRFDQLLSAVGVIEWMTYTTDMCLLGIVRVE